jgi:hypothetical protein
VATGAEAAGEPVAGEAPAPVGAAALVWANAEIIEITAIARRDRRNLLVIVSLKLLGTLFPWIWIWFP